MRENTLCIRIAFLEQPVIKLFGNCFTLIVELIYIPRAGMRDTHDGP